MTDPHPDFSPGDGSSPGGAPQPPPHVPPMPPPYTVGGYPYPPGAYHDPAAPWGRHPVTGEPLSDKSKVVAALLQLIGLFGVVGIGRIYTGDVTLGIIQMVVGILTCFLGAAIWGVVDAILILTDKVRDPQGRPLRDGT